MLYMFYLIYNFYFQFYFQKYYFSLSRFFNLLYKNTGFQKMKSVLTFSKWTKKMSKIDLPKTSLLTDFFCDDIENLS